MIFFDYMINSLKWGNLRAEIIQIIKKNQSILIFWFSKNIPCTGGGLCQVEGVVYVRETEWPIEAPLPELKKSKEV